MKALQALGLLVLLVLAGCVHQSNQNGSSEPKFQLASLRSAEDQNGLSVGGRSYISMQSLNPEYRDLGCYPGEFIKNYPSGTRPDPEAFQVWQGEWEIWHQPKPASWQGGFIQNMRVSPREKTIGGIVFQGERLACNGCEFRVQPMPKLTMSGWVVGKFLVIPPPPGDTRMTIYWYEKRGEDVFLFGSMWSPEMNACYERRGIKKIPTIKTASGEE